MNGFGRWTLVLIAVSMVSCAWGRIDAVGEELGDVLRAPGLDRPTATRYADPAWYDLVDVRWAEGGERPAALLVELAAVDDERPLLQPIVEAYLVDEETPWRTLLPGSNTALPADRGWSVAVRVTADGAWAWSPDGGTAVPRRLVATVEDRTIRLTWPADLPTEGGWVALTGVFDPFSETGWRSFERAPSPWAFSAADTERPVVDVLPGGTEALEAVWSTGLLPLRQRGGPVGLGSGWWWLMGLGLALGVAGLVWRRRPVAAAPTPPAPRPVVVPVLPTRGAANVPSASAPAASAPVPSAPLTSAPRPRPEPRWTPLIDDAEAPTASDVEPLRTVRKVREVRVEVAPFGAPPMTATGDQPPVEPPEADLSSAEDALDVTDTGAGSDDASASEDGASSRETRAPSDAKRSAKRS